MSERWPPCSTVYCARNCSTDSPVSSLSSAGSPSCVARTKRHQRVVAHADEQLQALVARQRLAALDATNGVDRAHTMRRLQLTQRRKLVARNSVGQHSTASASSSMSSVAIVIASSSSSGIAFATSTLARFSASSVLLDALGVAANVKLDKVCASRHADEQRVVVGRKEELTDTTARTATLNRANVLRGDWRSARTAASVQADASTSGSANCTETSAPIGAVDASAAVASGRAKSLCAAIDRDATRGAFGLVSNSMSQTRKQTVIGTSDETTLEAVGGESPDLGSDDRQPCADSAAWRRPTT
jgi:hypothetical protein